MARIPCWPELKHGELPPCRMGEPGTKGINNQKILGLGVGSVIKGKQGRKA